MSFIKTLPVRYHLQDNGFYCGLACAQMTIDALDTSGASLLDQADLATEKLPPLESGWATAPDQLSPLLNGHRPGTLPGSYALFDTTSKSTLARKIAWSIFQYQTPIIALVYGDSHWLVVCGFESSAPPTGPTDSSYTIDAFRIRNPLKVPGAPPCPHTGTDICGTGGVYGLADEHLAYSQWEAFYLAPISGPSYWEGKFLAICDTDPPAPLTGAQAKPIQKLRGDRIVPPDQLGPLAVAALKHHRLDEAWKDYLTGTSPGTPHLVQRLDRLDAFYYLVPFAKGQSIPVAVCLDGRYGNYQQAGRTRDSTGNVFLNLSFKAQDAWQKARSYPIDFGQRGKLRLREEGSVLYPTLVWRPCRESPSPFLPFFMIIAGSRRVYVRVDGQVFAKLHTRDRGN